MGDYSQRLPTNFYYDYSKIMACLLVGFYFTRNYDVEVAYEMCGEIDESEELLPLQESMEIYENENDCGYFHCNSSCLRFGVRIRTKPCKKSCRSRSFIQNND